MNYYRITYTKRCEIERMCNPFLKQKYTISTIAKTLNRSYSSIYRELQRNRLNSKWYVAEHAHYNAEKRRKATRRCPKTEHVEIENQGSKYLSLGLSPDIMVGRATIEGIDLPISRTAIYTLIYKNTTRGGNLHKKLLSKRKKRRSRRIKRTKGTFESTKIRVDQRPQEINDKIVLGHWEMDTIVGAKHKGSCHTMIERVSRFGQVIALNAPHSAQTKSHCWTLKNMYPDKVLSFTTDNGAEFSYHSVAYKDSYIPVYFAYPHSPWDSNILVECASTYST